MGYWVTNKNLNCHYLCVINGGADGHYSLPLIDTVVILHIKGVTKLHTPCFGQSRFITIMVVQSLFECHIYC